MPKTILVVDDQPSMRWVLARLLAQEGFLVKSAETGSAALAIVQTDEIHAAIVDFHLPDMTGIELYKNAVKIRPELPVVLMSSCGPPELRDEAVQAGMLGYFDKPIDVSRVLMDLEEAGIRFDLRGV